MEDNQLRPRILILKKPNNMNKYSFIFLLALLIVLSQCQSKPAESAGSSTQVVVANPLLGGYDTQEEWGKHLVTITGCNDCHTPKKMTDHGPAIDTSLTLSGHPAMMPKIDIDRKMIQSKGLAVTADLTEWVGPWGTSYAANLTPDPSGTGNWTEANFILALREGKFKGMAEGRPLLPPMPWEMFKHMTDYEIKAIFAYLKTIKPVNNVVPAPLPPADMAEAGGPSKAAKKK